MLNFVSYSIKVQKGNIRISKGSLVVFNVERQNDLSILQGLSSYGVKCMVKWKTNTIICCIKIRRDL